MEKCEFFKRTKNEWKENLKQNLYNLKCNLI